MNSLSADGCRAAVFAAAVLVASIPAQFAFAQGSLTPPGPPAPTMKTLDQIEARTPIDTAHTPGDATNLFIITQPGAYYLTGNVTGVAGKNGIKVAASDVSIDLNGFTMTGTGGTTKGVDCLTNTPTRVRVFNGQVKGWGTHGIFVYRNSEVDRVIASGTNGVGIGADAGSIVSHCVAESNVARGFSLGDDSIIRDCTGNQNDSGLFLSDGGRAEHCVFNGNGHDGMSLGSGVTVSDCTANFNGTKAPASGMLVATNETRSTISRSTCLGNTGAGIILGANCVVSDCTITGNTLDGITTTVGTTQKQNRVTRCLINGNATSSGNGVTLIELSTVTDSVVCENGSGTNLAAGIKMRSSARVSGCTVNNNNGRGIYVAGSSLVRDNTVCSNGTGGASNGIETTFLSGTGSSVESNYVRDNSGIGILLGTFDVAIRNVSGGNGPTNTANYNPNNGSLSPVQAAGSATNPFANISLPQ